jgi:hypothetical protein
MSTKVHTRLGEVPRMGLTQQGSEFLLVPDVGKQLQH